MHYAVPQFIEVEDKIIGPLTMKQFLWLLLGGAIIFILYFLLQFGVWIAVSIIMGSITAALAFFRVYNMPLIAFIFSFIRFSLMPQIFLWHKQVQGPVREVPERAVFENELQAAPAQKPRPAQGRLRALAWQLDISGAPDEHQGAS